MSKFLNNGFDPWAPEEGFSCRSWEEKIERKIAVAGRGRNICFGGKGGGGSSSSPDPQIGQAALMQAKTGEDWLTFSKEVYADSIPRQEKMDALTEKVTNQQLETADQQSAWAEEDRARTQEVYQPIEDEYVQTAKDYGSAANQEKEAATAAADIKSATESQAATSQRQMAAMGLNPSSGRWAGQDRAADLTTALGTAGAKNAARTATRDKGLALKADAINMGKGYASTAAQAASTGLNAGSSAVGNSNTAMSSWRANTGIMGQGFQGAQQGYAGQANTLNQSWSNSLKADQINAGVDAANSQATGQAAGGAAMAYAAYAF